MEMWRKAWRDEIVRRFSDKGVAALRNAILIDDHRLIQNLTFGENEQGVCAACERLWKKADLFTLVSILTTCQPVNYHISNVRKGFTWNLLHCCLVT